MNLLYVHTNGGQQIMKKANPYFVYINPSYPGEVWIIFIFYFLTQQKGDYFFKSHFKQQK